MKNTTIITLAAMLLGAAGAIAQEAYTKPAGFVTHTLKAGQFNLIGLTLHEPVTVAGELDSVNGQVLGDNEVNFGTALTDGQTYILEITAASDTTLVGTIQEIVGGSNATITTPDDLDAQGLVVGDKYQIRAAKTLQGVFGGSNESGLQEGASGTADLVWIPNSSASFDKYYYHPGASFPVAVTEGWKLVGGGDAPIVPICFTDSVFVQRRGSTDLSLVVTGSVSTQTVVVAVPGVYNFISNVFPVGSTLENSGLSSSMQQGASGSADLLWIPTEDATDYDKYYFHPGSSFPTSVVAGWKLLGGDIATDQKATPLKSGMIIQRRAVNPYNAPITPPASYSGL